MVSFLRPSTGSILRYFTDVSHAAASIAPFARMIEALAENTKASSIEVVAFSAGATFPPDFKDRVQRLSTPASAASSPR